MISRLKKQTTPLCFMPDGRLVCYHRGNIIVLRDGKELFSMPIPISKKERYLGWSKYASRLMRLGVRSAIALDNEQVLLSVGNNVYELSLQKKELSKGWYCGAGIRPLLFMEVKGIDGFDDGIYFGGYLSNRKKKPVNIYHRTGIDQWEIVYTFPEGTINHVHNIIPDSYRNCLWIFTGDFDEASAIWKVTNDFKNVEKVASNDQKYRGCVAYAIHDGLLYATDAPFMDDFIYLLNTDTLELKEIFPIHGSCIYGCQWNDSFVFSSTVEGDGRDTTKWEFYFGRKKGAGIKDNYVHMYSGNLQDGFKEIYREGKDCMPYYTFQFGVFKFPVGINNTNILYFQPVATRNYDLTLMSYTI